MLGGVAPCTPTRGTSFEEWSRQKICFANYLRPPRTLYGEKLRFSQGKEIEQRNIKRLSFTKRDGKPFSFCSISSRRKRR